MPGLRYLGRGEFIPGVPARDLTEAEASVFRGILAEHRRNTGRSLYGPPLPAVEEPRHGGPVVDAEPAAQPGTNAAGKSSKAREQADG